MISTKAKFINNEGQKKRYSKIMSCNACGCTSLLRPES